MSGPRAWHPETAAVAAGRDSSPGAPFNVPPTFASTYRDGGPVGYGRWGNPTWSAFEEALGALEGGHAVAFASGQAAIAALLAPLPAGADLLWLESPTNPLLEVADLPRILHAANQAGVPAVVDNTFGAGA